MVVGSLGRKHLQPPYTFIGESSDSLALHNLAGRRSGVVGCIFAPHQNHLPEQILNSKQLQFAPAHLLAGENIPHFPSPEKNTLSTILTRTLMPPSPHHLIIPPKIPNRRTNHMHQASKWKNQNNTHAQKYMQLIDQTHRLYGCRRFKWL